MDFRDDKPLLGHEVDPVFDALYRAVKRWGQSPRSGLRQLRILERRHVNHKQANADFLQAVVKYCPNIEYIDGWKGSYSVYKFSICFDQWASSLDLWQAFCCTCVKLREFSWIVVPFTNAYLAPFGATPKPHLRRLRIEFSSPAPFQIHQDEYSQAGLLAMLQGLEALEDLVFEFQHNLQYEIDAEALLTDSFFVELCRCCPNLRRLYVDDTPFVSYVKQLGGISDTSLLALASLASMQTLECTVPFTVSVRAVLSYLLDGPGRNSQLREAVIDISGNTQPDQFIPSLLLSELRAGPWLKQLQRGRRFVLLLYDVGIAPLSRIKSIAADFQHVDIRLQTGFRVSRLEKGKRFRVSSFLLYTSDAPLSKRWRREFQTDDGDAIVFD
ncbi:hypothetical protein P43SY_005731 [Pythium insidiosum]|uniref:Uncharacterized protein n=1 Tax=Pythium insidiosum TaxID=114742 RepID=A0AAD5M9Q3_PYTIN|nr:hypothetical protein P43SY_005731 [Pythium insidiosum]